MFLAVRDINSRGKIFKAGEVVTDAKEWDGVALQSCLNIGWIKEVPDSEKALEETPEPSSFKEEPRLEAEAKLTCKSCKREFASQRALTVHARSHRS